MLAMGPSSYEPKGTELVAEGAKTSSVHIILDGFACCYNVTRSGKRQIFSYLVPGDSCDLHSTLLDRSDFAVRTLSDCKVARIAHASINEITTQYRDIAKALWWCSLVDAAILQAWLTGIGRRSADKRIAHLFCELHCRLKAVGLTSDGEFRVPITQQDLADTVGMSSVHVNRSLMRLRREGWVSFAHQEVIIHDVHRLAVYADFDEGYLHLDEHAGGQMRIRAVQ